MHQEMSKPLLTLGFKRMPGGMLGREVQYGDWPDPKEMAPQGFLRSLSQRTHANSPAQMQQYDLVKELLVARAKMLAPELLKKLHAEDAAFFHILAADLKCKPGSGPARVASALARSNAAFLAYDALHREFGRTFKRMKAVSEMEQMRHARTWSQHLNDEDVDGDGEGSEGEEASRPRSRRVFRLVTRLWVFPREPKQGEDPPYVCHSGLDFERLRVELESTFRYGPPVRIRVANDTIDRVTLHSRGADQLQCSDFGALLLARSKRSRESVIGVRSAWAPLHHMKDRDYCPPPSLIMFVAEANNFTDAIFWLDQSKGLVGQEMAMDFLYDKGKKTWGTLPSRLQGLLEQLFNTRYDGRCLLGGAAEAGACLDPRGARSA